MAHKTTAVQLGVEYIQFDHSAVQETFKIPGNIALFSLHTYRVPTVMT